MYTKVSLIESLINEGYLKSPRIIDAFRAIDRADFVLPEYRDEAYGNYPLSISEGQTISQPLTVAFMLELLDPHKGEKILDIGAGSGWQSGLLAHIVSEKGETTAVERIKSLCDFAKYNLEKYGFIKSGRVKFYCLDATSEIPGGPYDKIIAAAAASKDIPAVWREKLKIGGRIVAPVDGSVWRFTRVSKNEWSEEEFPGFAFVPLVRNTNSANRNEQREQKQVDNKSPASPFRKWVNGIFIIFLVLFAGAAVLVNEIYSPRTTFDGSKTVIVPAGSGSREISDILKKEGLIRSKLIFILYASARGTASELRPGSYTWNSVSLNTIVNDLVRGTTRERIITIPEGWSVKDVAAYFDREGIAERNEFFQAVSDPSKVWVIKFPFLAEIPVGGGLEGYLFPDTYRVFADARSEDIIEKMLDNFDKKLTAELREEITRQKRTIFEAITMASLIEKEVVSDEDRAVVSGILWKRLDAGIPLQIDATITYITEKRTTKISREEIQINSPYNTYKYAGLPKGPIANPGLSAIRAAIHPKPSPHLYYLSAPDGTTIFSRTLEEHNAAKAKYLHFDCKARRLGLRVSLSRTPPAMEVEVP